MVSRDVGEAKWQRRLIEVGVGHSGGVLFQGRGRAISGREEERGREREQGSEEAGGKIHTTRKRGKH